MTPNSTPRFRSVSIVALLGALSLSSCILPPPPPPLLPGPPIRRHDHYRRGPEIIPVPVPVPAPYHPHGYYRY